MRAGETELQMSVRHVAEQENRIARQDILAERLRESGSSLLDDALQLLAEMHGLLEKMHEHVARLSNQGKRTPMRAASSALSASPSY
jgi:hypothetical protein